MSWAAIDLIDPKREVSWDKAQGNTYCTYLLPLRQRATTAAEDILELLPTLTISQRQQLLEALKSSSNSKSAVESTERALEF